MTVKSSFEYFTLERKLLMYKIEEQVQDEVLRDEFKKIETLYNQTFPKVTLSLPQALLFYFFLIFLSAIFICACFFYLEIMILILEAPILKMCLLSAPPGILGLYANRKKNNTH